MKVVAEYLQRVRSFERLAKNEQITEFKRELLKQAAAYRKLATDRANKLNLPPPRRS
jgi:hypothetical protein